METTERHLIEATLRRCNRQPARPMGVSRSDEKTAMDYGFLRFVEYPSGHYHITEAGQEFLNGVAY